MEVSTVKVSTLEITPHFYCLRFSLFIFHALWSALTPQHHYFESLAANPAAADSLPTFIFYIQSPLQRHNGENHREHFKTSLSAEVLTLLLLLLLLLLTPAQIHFLYTIFMEYHNKA